jgi:hypothetical protein
MGIGRGGQRPERSWDVFSAGQARGTESPVIAVDRAERCRRAVRRASVYDERYCEPSLLGADQ